MPTDDPEKSDGMRDLLIMLSRAPAGQAERHVTKRCAEMAENGYTAAEVKTFLDEIAHASTASDFFIAALDMVWQDALKTVAAT